MSKVLNRKSIFFNSKGLPTVGSAKNSFTILLPSDIFNVGDPLTYARVYIKKAVIPNNFNNINSSNNEYIWGGVSYTLQNGDPDIYEILNELSSNGIQATYDTYTSLVSITSSGTLDLTAINSCASVLGFNKTVINTPAVGVYPVQVRMTNSIFIESNLAVESSYEYSTEITGTSVQGEIIASPKLLLLPINVARFSNIIYEDDVGYNSIVIGANQKYTSVFFALVDDIGNALQIETDWSAELVIEIVQDQNSQIIQLLQDIKTLNQDVKTFHHIDLMDKAIKDPFWSVF